MNKKWIIQELESILNEELIVLWEEYENERHKRSNSRLPYVAKI